MTIHYHGIPLTPKEMLYDMAGKHVCISYATHTRFQLMFCLDKCQSIMFDNGAFSIHQNGGVLDVKAFCKWVDPMLIHPHWAVCPDVINGTEDDQRAMLKQWPFDRFLSAPVWHLGLSLDYLIELADNWPRICFGSSQQYWKVGGSDWKRRMEQAVNELSKRTSVDPWIHGLRMMDQVDKGWPLASVDSVNVARNYKDRQDMPGRMADRIDARNNSVRIPE
jgi:hypothetical protein